MREVVVVGAVRTPVGSFGGSLKDMNAVDLGALVIKEALRRAGVDANQVDEVIMGNVLQAGLGQNPARQASLRAGLPMNVPAFTINKVCSSGLKAINLGGCGHYVGRCGCGGGRRHGKYEPGALSSAERPLGAAYG